jgi:tRNA nucleotidyltransferase (CCA-adding enzyme)
MELEAGELLEILQKLDAFRRPQRFAQFLMACEADFRVRWGFSGQIYPPAKFFRETFKIANQVNVSKIIAAGFKGAAIQKELQRQRTQALAQFLKS